MTINTIDPAVPDPNDPAGQGDDQIRALKQVIADTFPQVPTATPTDPWDIVLEVGPRAVNDVVNKATQVDLDALDVRVGVEELATIDHETRISTNETDIATLQSTQIDTSDAWPVGSMFISADGASPTTKGIAGTWAVRGDGRFLMGASSGFGSTGGSSAVTLVAGNIPLHKHTHALPHKSGPNFGTWAAAGKTEYAVSPTRSQTVSRVGEDANEVGWSIQNTSDGADYTPAPLGSAPVALPDPPFLTVRFYERTA